MKLLMQNKETFRTFSVSHYGNILAWEESFNCKKVHFVFMLIFFIFSFEQCVVQNCKIFLLQSRDK